MILAECSLVDGFRHVGVGVSHISVYVTCICELCGLLGHGEHVITGMPYMMLCGVVQWCMVSTGEREGRESPHRIPGVRGKNQPTNRLTPLMTHRTVDRIVMGDMW